MNDWVSLVTSRKGRVSRNAKYALQLTGQYTVTSRKGRVSRNLKQENPATNENHVTSRKGRVSRNFTTDIYSSLSNVTSRKGRVSRNLRLHYIEQKPLRSRPARGV